LSETAGGCYDRNVLTSSPIMAGVTLAACAGVGPALVDAQERWILVRPPLDDVRLEALARDPGFQAASPDDQAAAVAAVAVDPRAPLSRWQRWVEYETQGGCEAGRAQLEAEARRGLQDLARYAPNSPEGHGAKHAVRIEAEVEIRRLQGARCIPASAAPP
jgi:hypothetical protein